MSVGHTHGTYLVWGSAHSLYTGKLRSYLIKKGLPYRELLPAQPGYGSRVVPQLGFLVLPVLETPDGDIVQDTSIIIEHLEARLPEPRLEPSSPLQAAVAALIGAFGSEALLRPAMHYRWSYFAQQKEFLVAEFGRFICPSRDRGERAAAAAPWMQAMNDYLPALGVGADSIAAIERAYEDLLQVLDEHFLHHPYILGGRPSSADFGLMAPLYAHLARDPYPSALMKRLAPNVFRWTERMNLAGFFDGEFPDSGEDYLPGDALPETIEPLLALIFRDWGPELLANAAVYNNWIAARPQPAAGTMVSATGERKVHPTLGPIEFTLRGAAIRCASMPQALWHFERAAARARALTGEAKSRFETLVGASGGEEAMAIRLARPIVRENNVLVVGAG
jgi:glutathione S-transferase